MSSKDDLIEDGVPDEASELTALARALFLATGFKLLLVRYRGEAHRLRLVAALQTALPGRKICEIRLSSKTSHLLDFLRDELAEKQPDAVFVSGFDLALPNPDFANDSPLVANLNASRDLFPLVVPCPLVLWVPEYILQAIARGAPDFFSVRSGAYLFVDHVDELSEVAKQLTTLEAGQLGPDADQLRQRLLISLNRPQSERDRTKEAELLGRLGAMLHARGQWSMAIECCSTALRVYGDAAPIAWRTEMLFLSADSRRRIGKLVEAQMDYEHVVAAAHQTGDHALEAQALSGIGNVLSLQGNRDDGIRAYSEALQVVGNRDPKLTRKIALRLADMAGGPPPSILFLAANPSDTTRLSLDREAREIRDSLDRGRARAVFHTAEAVRLDDLLPMLQRYKPDLVHFSGHGTQGGGIILEDNNGRSRPLGMTALAHLFHSLKHIPRCLVLNTAYSSRNVEAVLRDVDFVVAMTNVVTDVSAISFCRAFYLALAYGRPVDEAVQMGNIQLIVEGSSQDNAYQLFIRPGVEAGSMIIIPKDEDL